MADCGSVIQSRDIDTGTRRPLQLWKATFTLDAATGSFTSPEDLSGVVVAAWIDPSTLTASATIKVHDLNDDFSTPTYAVDYTAPNPAVETKAALAARCYVNGQLQCDVADATSGDSFTLYLWVDANADKMLVDADGHVSVDVTGIVSNVDLDVEPADLGVHAEDAAHVSGEAGVMMLGVRQDTASAFGANGDYVPFSMDSSGAARVSVVSEQATFYTEDAPIDENTVGQTVMLKRQDTLSATEVDTDEDGVALRGTAKGQAHVYCDGAVAASGGVAHGSPDSGNPVKIGGKAVTALPTPVDVDDRADAVTDLYGQLRTTDAHLGLWYANGDYTGAQTNTSLKAAPAAGLYLYVTDILVTNDATAAITVKLLDGSGGNNLTGTQKVPASGGFVINFRTPLKLTAATALCLTTTGTSNFSVLISGYTAG